MKKHLRIIGLSNELPKVGDPLIIPFGSYPHKVGKVMQMINSKTVAMMVNEFNAMASRPGFKGVPVFIGHPDVKGFYDKYPDHRSYAWITEMIANEDAQCLELYPDWTEPGAELITNEHFAYFSPNWLAVKGRPGEALPFKIKSIGLTHEPMIEYLALACEDGGEDEPINQNEGNKMNLLQRLLALLPEKKQEDIKTDDDVVGFFQKMLDGFKALRESQQERWKAEDAAYMALENEDPLAGLTAYIEELGNQALALANEVPEDTAATLTQVTEELSLANESLTTLRAKHSGLLLDVALSDGRITPATRKKWEDRFGAEDADFTVLANELGSIDPTMKTSRSANNAEPGGGQKTLTDLTVESTALANESNTSFESAYASLKNTEDFAHLFTSE